MGSVAELVRLCKEYYGDRAEEVLEECRSRRWVCYVRPVPDSTTKFEFAWVDMETS